MKKITLLGLLLLTSLQAGMRMAPDGTYVNGRPQLAPDGSYVGSGTIVMTPRGKYIADDTPKEDTLVDRYNGYDYRFDGGYDDDFHRHDVSY